jgi:hypothetical protein
MEDMNKAISLHREALDLRPVGHPARSLSLSNLSKVIMTRFGLTGNLEDMNEAILLQNEALALRPHSHPERSDSLLALRALPHRMKLIHLDPQYFHFG